MINRQNLLKDLQQQLPKIERDILAYSESQPELTQHLKDEYQKAVIAKRTADHFVAWREGQITQAAVAWILTCVFVRFLEDNQLLDEPMLAGPGERLKHARSRIEVHFNDNPTHGERDYLLALFAELEKLPAIKELLDHQHNPLWQIPVSSDGAKLLVDFFQKIDPATGEIIHDFTDPDWDTRFLGDLYQDLSIDVQKKYALLQTPEFVESFILDYTLEKAKDTFGLKGLRMIDPTCGSGHFLLTGFERIFNDWIRREPSEQTRVLAQRALNSVYGVDLNPYAIAICRFRLLMAAMKVTGTRTMRQAPDFHYNLAVGDSLLHGRRFERTGVATQAHLMEEDEPVKHVLDTEDKAKLQLILGQQYHAVVGNPPYITVKDSAVREAIRDRYETCHGKYSLGVPFTERFFELCQNENASQNAGYMGMITTNSFMKRGFGKKLIEMFVPNKDLTHIIDTSGAYIPGHGTPTVILFGRNRRSSRPDIRVALGKRAEPSTPVNASDGLVWTSILEQIDSKSSENDFIQVEDKDRSLYMKHPWNLTGGGAVELKAYIEANSKGRLEDYVISIGPASFPGLDDTFIFDDKILRRYIKNGAYSKPFVYGESVRDWCFEPDTYAFAPYGKDHYPLPLDGDAPWARFLWPYKNNLENLVSFAGRTRKDLGQSWWTWYRWIRERFTQPLAISFAEVASHNHFTFLRGDVVYKQTAPVVKLNIDKTDEDYISLTGFLNSSASCFYMKQVSHQKQMTGGDGVRVESISKVPYQYAGTALGTLPLPIQNLNSILGACSTAVDKKVQELKALTAANAIVAALLDSHEINEVWDTYVFAKSRLRSAMILLQEEIDWICYWAFGLCDKGFLADDIEPWIDTGLDVGQRPFEILAQLNQDGFTVPDDVPSHWPESMQDKWRQRMDAINTIKELRVIENPHYKRRWVGRQGLFNKAARADELKTACKEWLLDRLENHYLKHDSELITCAGLADRVRTDADFNKVAAHYTGNELFDIQKLVVDLVATETIPQMAPARYKPSGITKFRAWQETWDKQRSEDAIDARTELPEDHADYLSKDIAEQLKKESIGDIPVPPKYVNKDFTKAAFWPLRGKLDVPKERFFSLPGCEKSGDTTPVIGWAGMNHLQRATAIVVWYQDRKEVDGFSREQLMPMLVAIDELIPWLKQWHNELDPEYELKMGDYYETWLLEELKDLDIARSELLSWVPPVVKKARKPKKATA